MFSKMTYKFLIYMAAIQVKEIKKFNYLKKITELISNKNSQQTINIYLYFYL